jgi:hypothetical protein
MRVQRVKNSFGFVYYVLVLLVVNGFIYMFSAGIEMNMSLNDKIRLYGAKEIPAILHGLLAPLAIGPSLLGIFGIPAMVYQGQRNSETERLRSYREKAMTGLKVCGLVSLISLIAHFTYYFLYVSLGENLPVGNFSIAELFQIVPVMTAVAVILYIYITDTGKKGMAIYWILTFCFAWSGFLAGLPHPEGQPVYDDSLWLSVPLAIISMTCEMFVIPYVFRRLENAKKMRVDKDRRWE